MESKGRLQSSVIDEFTAMNIATTVAEFKIKSKMIYKKKGEGRKIAYTIKKSVKISKNFAKKV